MPPKAINWIARFDRSDNVGRRVRPFSFDLPL